MDLRNIVIWYECVILTIVTYRVQRVPAFDFLNPMKEPTQLSPMDALAFVGETLRISCTHPDFKDDLSQARFKITVGGTQSWFLPRDNLTSFGNSTVQTYVHITEAFHAFNDLLCYKGDTYLRSTKLYVEKPLILISNVSAVFLYDRLSYVQLKWSSNSEYYKDPQDIKISVFYSFGGIPKDWKKDGTECNGDPNVCYAPGWNNRMYFYALFEVTHTLAQNRPALEFLQPIFNTSLAIEYGFNLTEIRKTAPVTDVKVESKSATCANLTWTLPFYFDVCHDCSPLHYQMQLITEEDKRWWHYGIQSPPSSKKSVTICGLTAYTQYHLYVRVKDLEVNPWSDFSTPVQLRTAEDRPLLGPSNLPTDYHIERPCENDLRTVLVYWKDQSQSTVRGELIGYEINAQNETSKLRPSSNYFRASLPCHTGAMVQIFTLTKKGPSLTPSTIYVPGSGDRKDLVQNSDIQFVVKEIFDGSREQKTLSATWKPEVLDQNGSQVVLTFYMCEEAEPNTCFSEYEIEQTAAGKGKILQKNISRSQNLFGYSLQNSQGQKTGVVWTDCVYQEDRVPLKPTGLKAIPGDESGSVQVIWYNMRCNRKGKVLITAYNLSICPQKMQATDNSIQNHGNCQTSYQPNCICLNLSSDVSVTSSGTSSFTFRNLDPGSYTVYLNAKSNGGVSPISTAIATVSSGKKDNTWKIILTTTLLVLLLPIIAVFVFCICYWKHGKKKIDELSAQTMKLMDQPKDEPPTFVADSDSGVYSTAVALEAPTLPNLSVSQPVEETLESSTSGASEQSAQAHSGKTGQQSYDSLDHYSKQNTIDGRLSLAQNSKKGRRVSQNKENRLVSIKEKQGRNLARKFETPNTQVFAENISPHLKTAVVQNCSVKHGRSLHNQSMGVAKPSEYTFEKEGIENIEHSGAESFPSKCEDGYTEEPSGLKGACNTQSSSGFTEHGHPCEQERDATLGSSLEPHSYSGITTAPATGISDQQDTFL